ncbi:DUF3157 family protein [Vibrio paucivorans]|uniref:DUF3157 family protein n=1 Tax=Vibrio paucivorans TaxID=2829489 RepID=A0A9X3HQM6_9VIBR|nr:DUF3157 family protein [Vibrio paucivorans]MCW8333565.1 DUF3157 family protein [Vibrio paucivorans]
MKNGIAFACLLATSSTYAAEQVTLEDGRQVQLNDDFTWQYVPEPATDQSEVKQAVEPAVVAIPVVTQKVGTLVTVGSKKPTMQLSDSGVDVLLGSAQYQDGELVIPTSLTNQSSQSVILVTVDITVSDTTGKVLFSGSVDIWKSIKRMADTYLRPQQAEQGKTIQLDLDEHKQYQVSAHISQVSTR